MSFRPKLVHLSVNTLLVASIGLFGYAVWLRYGPRAHDSVKPSIAFLPGREAPRIEGVDYKDQDRSLVVFMSTTCRYCIESVPFYNRISAISSKSPRRFQFYAVFSEPKAEVEAARSRLGLSANIVSLISFRNLGVRSTPTALLVNRNGVITRIWMGASATNERDIASEVGR